MLTVRQNLLESTEVKSCLCIDCIQKFRPHLLLAAQNKIPPVISLSIYKHNIIIDKKIAEGTSMYVFTFSQRERERV